LYTDHYVPVQDLIEEQHRELHIRFMDWIKGIIYGKQKK
jgi:hypothetical protein